MLKYESYAQDRDVAITPLPTATHQNSVIQYLAKELIPQNALTSCMSPEGKLKHFARLDKETGPQQRRTKVRRLNLVYEIIFQWLWPPICHGFYLTFDSPILQQAIFSLSPLWVLSIVLFAP